MGASVSIHICDGTSPEHSMTNPLSHRKYNVSFAGRHIFSAEFDIVPCFFDQSFPRFFRKLNQLPIDIQNKTGGILRRTVKVPALCPGKIQQLFRACNGHKSQPSFFLHGFQRSNFPGGEDSLIHTAQKDTGELQTLSCVDGHQLHLSFAVQTVCVGKESHVAQIMLQRTFLTAGGFVFINGLLQFRQIVQSFLAPFGAKHFLISAFVQDIRQHLRNRTSRLPAGKPFHQRYKLPGLRTFKYRILQCCLQCLIQCTAVLFGIIL